MKGMKVEIREAKSIITKSNIPTIDFVINPYTGCQHGCVYCYAEFMIRFSGHKGEKWGTFLDIKKYDLNRINPAKYNGKKILLSSVTDPYLPLENKYQNTKKILKSLVGTTADIQILTKSKLVTRDIELFKQVKNIKVGISISSLDEEFSKIIERAASKPRERLEAIKKIHEKGVQTYIFISPIFPGITDYKEIIKETADFSDEYSFENLNFRPHNISRIHKIIEACNPELLSRYKEIQKDRTYWDLLETKIVDYCEENKLIHDIEFHHGGF